QQRLWFLEQFEPDSTVYNFPSTLRLCGPFHVAALERSLQEIIRRHEVLRSTFQSSDSDPVQVIAAAGKLQLALNDLRELPEVERESEALRLTGEETRRAFDLSRDLLL